MADTKITALAAIGANPIIPATFPIPMVDLTDTSMAASGTTKKVTVNQILGAGGTATLASATITGDLTVDTSTLKVDSTNNRVGIATATPGVRVDIVSDSNTSLAPVLRVNSNNVAVSTSLAYDGLIGSSTLTIQSGTSAAMIFNTNNVNERYRIASDGVATWSNVGGVAGTAMTLDANGLGIGLSPSGGAAGSVYSAGSVLAAGGLTAHQTNRGVLGYGSNETTIRSYGATAGTGFITFRVAGGGASTDTEAGRFDASGNLLVGTTTNTNVSRIFSRGTATSSALALQGASGDVALAQLTVGKFDNDTTTSQIFVRFTINDNSGGSGQINANGASQAAFGTFSDSRLKENIVSLPSQLANILSLRPVEFDYKDGSGHQIGFVAQEIQKVYSDTVGEQDGFLTVTGWSKTEARLVSAIKELAAKVQALESKLA